MHTLRCSLGVALLFSLTSTASFAFSARGTRSPETSLVKSGAAKGTANGSRFSNTSAPGAVKPTPQQPAPTEVTYVQCKGTNQGKEIILWLGDYQGKIQSKVSGPGASDAARDLYAPVQMTVGKSSDGKTCQFIASRGGVKSWNFVFPMAQGPNSVQLSMGTAKLNCSGMPSAPDAAVIAMKACQKPPILTNANTNPQCKPSAPDLLYKQAYDCSLSEYQRHPGSRYSVQKCDPKIDSNVCVAKMSCHVKDKLPQNMESRRDALKTDVSTYVICTPNLGVCNKTIDDCLADNSIYFKNPETAQGQVRMDVGLDQVEAGIVLAPAEEPAPASSGRSDVETNVVIKRSTDDGWKMDDDERPKARVVPTSRGAQ